MERAILGLTLADVMNLAYQLAVRTGIKLCVQCYRVHNVIGVLDLWCWERGLCHLCVHNIYTQYVHCRALYNCVNVCTRWFKYDRD